MAFFHLRFTVLTMPELPEVETVVRGLREKLINKKLLTLESFHPRAFHSDLNKVSKEEILNKKIIEIHRRGKYIWFEFNSPIALITHLGMSGQYLFPGNNSSCPKHVRAEFTFKPDLKLLFNDQRTFGWIGFDRIDPISLIPNHLHKVALDIFDTNFNKTQVFNKYTASSVKIKHLLLNQEIMSGVGNIYADEALWFSKIHPDRVGSSLSKIEFNSLLFNLRKIFAKAISLGGTTFDTQYLSTDGSIGKGAINIKVYGRENQPCYRCGFLIVRINFGLRYTRFCPNCQQYITLSSKNN
jgi:formamidopyrimidine-DNA glycosylase